MGEIVNLSKKEMTRITKRSSLVGMDYNPKDAKEVAKMWLDVPQIAAIAKQGIEDHLYGKYLLIAKKDICGDEWDAQKLSNNISKKWLYFLETIDLVDKKGSQKMNVSYLLDFAGYKERGGEIEMASHFREVKKITGATNKEPEKIDEAYNEAGGKDLKTAKEVKESVTSSIKKVYVKNIFSEEVGVLDVECVSVIELQEDVITSMPEVDKNSWKEFYRFISKVIHPDKIGENDYISILNSLDKAMTHIHRREACMVKRKEYKNDYEQWKKDNGYESDFIPEDEVNL